MVAAGGAAVPGRARSPAGPVILLAVQKAGPGAAPTIDQLRNVFKQ